MFVGILPPSKKQEKKEDDYLCPEEVEEQKNGNPNADEEAQVCSPKKTEDDLNNSDFLHLQSSSCLKGSKIFDTRIVLYL